MNLQGQTVVVVGLGRSGIAAANLCARRGARVIGTDTVARSQAPAAMLALENQGVVLHLGGHENVPWHSADCVIVSPGVPSFAALQAFEHTGRPVIGELDLACRFATAPYAVVGGTNGKSTVTSWLGQMLAASFKKTFVGGNLGTPLSEQLDENFDAIVLEVSSFQAERVPALHPRAAALLNITDDHLDRYDSFEAYAHAKGNVFVNMKPGDVAVIPAGDQDCERQARRGQAELVRFGAGGDVFIEGSDLVHGPLGWRFDKTTIRLRGGHNEANACAAVAMAAAMGASYEGIASALTSFEALAHRTELVGEHHGVRFYDDSKGTNVGATVAALCGLQEPMAVLIAGGRDKQGSYEPLVRVLPDKARALVLIGEAADRIEQAVKDKVAVARAGTMSEAVSRAFALAQRGDAVLLSPMCSSYDMFRDYKERGKAFREAVARLIHGAEAAG